MYYFYMKEDRKITDRPHVINWTSKLLLDDLYKGDYSKIPNRMILEIKPNKNLEFTDVITTPFLLVTQIIKEVMALYEPNMFFKEIILLDKLFGQAKEYFLPLVQNKNVLSDKSSFTNFHTKLKEMILDQEKLDDTAVFYVDGTPREAGIWRVDIIESILHRAAYGFTIEEIKVM